MARYKINEQQLFGTQTKSILATKAVQPGIAYNGVSFKTATGITYMQYGSQASAQAQFNLISSSIDLNNILMSIDYVFNTDKQMLGYKMQDNCLLYPNNGGAYLNRILRYYLVDSTEPKKNFKYEIYWRMEGISKPIDEHYKNHLDLEKPINIEDFCGCWDVYEYVARKTPRTELDSYRNQYVPEIKEYDETNTTPNQSLKYSSIVYLDHCYKDIRDIGTTGKNQYNAKVVYNDDNAYFHLNEAINLESNREYLEQLDNKAVLARTYYGDGKVAGTILENQDFLKFGGFCNFYYDSDLLDNYNYLKQGIVWFKVPTEDQRNRRYTFINQNPKPFVLYVDQILHLLGYSRDNYQVVINGYKVSNSKHNSVYCQCNKYFTVAINSNSNEIHFTGDLQYDNLFEYQSDNMFIHIASLANNKKAIEVCLYDQSTTEQFLRLLANVVRDRYEIHLLDYNVPQGTSVNTLVNNIRNTINTNLVGTAGIENRLVSYRLVPKVDILAQSGLTNPTLMRNLFEQETDDKTIRTPYFIACSPRPRTPLVFDVVFIVKSGEQRYLLHYVYYSKIVFFKFIGSTEIPSSYQMPSYPLFALYGNDVERPIGMKENEYNQLIHKNLSIEIIPSRNKMDTHTGNKKNRNCIASSGSMPKVSVNDANQDDYWTYLPITRELVLDGLYDFGSQNARLYTFFDYLPLNHIYRNFLPQHNFSTDSVITMRFTAYQRFLAYFASIGIDDEDIVDGLNRYSELYDDNRYAAIENNEYREGLEFDPCREYAVCSVVADKTNNSNTRLQNTREEAYFNDISLYQTTSRYTVANFTKLDTGRTIKTDGVSFDFKTTAQQGEDINITIRTQQKYAIMGEGFQYKVYNLENQVASPATVLLQSEVANETTTNEESETNKFEIQTKYAVQYRTFFKEYVEQMNIVRSNNVDSSNPYTLIASSMQEMLANVWAGQLVKGAYDMVYTPSNYIEMHENSNLETSNNESTPIYIGDISPQLSNTLDKDIFYKNAPTYVSYNIMNVVRGYRFDHFVALSTLPDVAKLYSLYTDRQNAAPLAAKYYRKYDGNRFKPFNIQNFQFSYLDDFRDENNNNNNYDVLDNMREQTLQNNIVSRYLDYNKNYSQYNLPPNVFDATNKIAVGGGDVQINLRRRMLAEGMMDALENQNWAVRIAFAPGLILTSLIYDFGVWLVRLFVKEEAAVNRFGFGGRTIYFTTKTIARDPNADSFRLFHNANNNLSNMGELWSDAVGTAFAFPTKNPNVLRYDMRSGHTNITKYTDDGREVNIFPDNYRAGYAIGGRIKKGVITNHALLKDDRVKYIATNKKVYGSGNVYLDYNSAWSTLNFSQTENQVEQNDPTVTNFWYQQQTNKRTIRVKYKTKDVVDLAMLVKRTAEYPFVTNIVNKLNLFNGFTAKINGTNNSQIFNQLCMLDDGGRTKTMLADNEFSEWRNKTAPQANRAILRMILNTHSMISTINNTYRHIPLTFKIGGNLIKIGDTSSLPQSKIYKIIHKKNGVFCYCEFQNRYQYEHQYNNILEINGSILFRLVDAYNSQTIDENAPFVASDINNIVENPLRLKITEGLRLVSCKEDEPVIKRNNILANVYTCNEAYKYYRTDGGDENSTDPIRVMVMFDAYYLIDNNMNKVANRKINVHDCTFKDGNKDY